MKKVSVIIPVYGQWDLVKRNIDGLLEHDRKNINEIIIVDDCSPDKNPYVFDDSIVNIITNDKNLGYTATINKGLKRAVSEIVVLLDSDAFPIAPFIERLIIMYADPNIGCIGFRTVDEDGIETGSFEKFRPSLIGLIVGQQLQLRLKNICFWRKPLILPYSCSISFNKLCLQELNYFDANTFPVLEADNDFAWRVHKSRWKLLFTREITVCHKGGNSYKVNYKRVLLYHESRWRLLKKHGNLKFPFFVKELMGVRIRLELMILFFLLIIKYKKSNIKEKIEGRKYLLQTVSSY